MPKCGVTYAFDADRTVEEQSCPVCARPYLLVKGFVYKDKRAHAVYFASCHQHDAYEVWIDVVLGTFNNEDWSDHVTFGCRVGRVGVQEDPGASLVTAAQPFGDSRLFGKKLTRDEALAHPLVSEFWRVVDFILLEDPLVVAHVYD